MSLLDDETLGDDQPTGAKMGYILLMFLVLGFLFLGTLGAGTQTKEVLYFYIIFGSVLGVAPILYDSATKGRGEVEQLDTVTIEEPAFDWLGPKVQILIGLAIGGYFAYRIATTGNAIVGYPEFGIFDSALGNAVLSGAVGLVENWVFFGFVGPTAYSFFGDRFGSRAFGALVMVLLTTSVFLGYHAFRYGADEAALMSVAFFGFINSVIVLVTRSLIVSDIFHFSNNFGATLFGAQRVAFQLG